nr:stage II sporulation protein E [Bacillus sp. HMF5848]
MQNLAVAKTRQNVQSLSHRLRVQLEHVLYDKGILCMVVGFLLGRALILSSITPFSMPYFVAVFIMQRKLAPLAAIAILSGSLTVSIPSFLFNFLGLVIFLISYRIMKRFSEDIIKLSPFLVFMSAFISEGVITYSWNSTLTLYDGLMTTVEAGLGFILTLIFLQSIPILTTRNRRQSLRPEEVISFIILLASIMTGTVGWVLYDVSLEHVASRYLVLLFAYSAGAAIGSTVGVVTGLVLGLAAVSNLYQMSLLAFSGLLGGLLKEGKKYGVSIGLLIGTLLIGMYGEGTYQLTYTIVESLIAILLFLITPSVVTTNIAKHIPGTNEHSQEQQLYVRKIRDVTANRVEQFSSVFQALSSSFSKIGHASADYDENQEIDYFLSNVTEKTCQACFKKEQCWSKNFNTTYELMKELMHETDINHSNINKKLAREWDRHCVKSNKVIDVMRHELTYYQANQKLKKQVQESRRLVADQLLGVSQVMEDFAREIQRERENHEKQEEQIYESLRHFGIEVEQVEIFSLKKGNVDIEMSIPYCNGSGECEKLIAPMLSDILQETIVVKKEECATFPNGYCRVSFGTLQAYVIDTGVAHAAKGGGFISGDSYSMIELGSSKYAIAISDGMGNGERAYYESTETLQLLQQILKTGIGEKVAIKSVNSILSLRTTDEIFSTLDLAIVDLQDANAKFLKIGSSPSFIKRADKVIALQASNLPIGIIQDFEVDVVNEQLKAGDLLIMMSDGIFEGVKHVENHDVWIRRKIREINTNKPQDMADLLMEEVIRSRDGLIEDDMTVIVARIEHNTPKWATIPVRQYIGKGDNKKRKII